MRYAQIRKMDISNGYGIGVSLFVQGCSRHCKGCFNKDTWDFNGGELYTSETRDQILSLLKNEHIKRLSILGGEPFEPINMPDVYDLINHTRILYGYNKKIWIYSGYTYVELFSLGKIARKILNNVDYLVDGAFDYSQKDLKLQFRGSSNQNIIHLREDL